MGARLSSVFLVGLVVKDSAYQCRRGETGVQSLGQEDPLEEDRATHSSIHAWKISWTEEPGGLQTMGHKELDTTERLNVLH